jgi:uncharacterized OB-fold protein
VADQRVSIPVPDSDSSAFWESCKKHEMAIQKCVDCGSLRYPPRLVCPNCLSANADWVKINGKGKVYTYVTYFQASGEWASRVPFNVTLVELDEGVRMWSTVVGCKPDEVYIGMPLEIAYEDVSDTVALPKFRSATSL